MATSGPGATNLVTALADAYMDSVPIVAITGQVPRAMIGTDAFQESDITGITGPITKHNELVTDPGRIPAAIAEAFHIASTGRPGPVLVDLPKDILQATTTWSWPPTLDLPGYQVPGPADPERIEAAARLLHQARRPFLYVGGGVVKSDSHDALRELAELTQAPVTTTLMARGAFPDSHPLALGMPGMHGMYAAVAALQEADLIVALGARFDDRVTGKLAAFAPKAKVVHADIDPAEIGKNRALVVAIDGDGCFQMTAQELATCAIEGLPIKVLIFNNGFLGMVRQWQELFYDERYSEVHLGTDIPDYVKLAEAYGCAGLRCEQPGDVDAVLEKALSATDVPAVVDFRTHDSDRLFRMVPAGQYNYAIVLSDHVSPAEQ